MVPRYVHSDTLVIRILSIDSSGLPNFNVLAMKHNDKYLFCIVSCKMLEDGSPVVTWIAN